MSVVKFEGIYKGNGRNILYDVQYDETVSQKLVPVVFIHGFKGYKNWGAFNLMANEFATKGCLFLKFSFSMNGTTKEKPCEFSDLNAFANNNFTLELEDLDSMLNLLETEYCKKVDRSQLTLIAHSRGGATAIIKTSQDIRVKRLILWASVGTIEGRMPKLNLDEFKRTNVIYVPNARTNQQMPIYYQFVEDYFENKEQLNLTKRAKMICVPTLLIQGDNDKTVRTEEALHLLECIKNSKLVMVKDGDHTFGATEPWSKDWMPKKLKEIVEESLSFIANN